MFPDPAAPATLATLYELSLLIGTSLDLERNCEAFLAAFERTSGVSTSTVYVRAGDLVLSDSPPGGDLASLECVYRLGPGPSAADVAPVPPDDDLLRRVASEGPISLPVVACPRLAAGSTGVVSALAFDDAILITCESARRDEPLEIAELEYARPLLAKFARSIEACLDHRRLMNETAMRIELQDRLARAERLESIGLLAGGVAHDLNNLLVPIIGYTEMVREHLPPGSPGREDLLAIESAASQAASVIGDLQAITRNRMTTREPTDLSAVVTSFLSSPAFTRIAAVHPHVSVTSRVREGTIVNGAFVPLSRIVMNLVTNAFEAMREPGELEVVVDRVALLEPRTVYDDVAPPGSYGRLLVRDEGCGIPPESLGRIFEPFFSSKPGGTTGSGLGLSVVYGIVKEFEGFIDIATSPRRTSFEILLLVADSPVSSRGAGDAGPRRRRRVLVVDDSPDQVRLAMRVLASSEIEVRGAESVDSALHEIRSAVPDAVVIDVRLGAEDGFELYRELRARHGPLPCLFVTAFSDSERLGAGFRIGGSGFLRKPYTPGELRRAVRELLEPPD